ncbi:kinase-like protein [Marasmius fiardii PR-910]|nr:kinase-like protein [Marasmius fiardii PR-910]
MLNSALSPITPAQRYPGWLSEVLKPLEEFIDESIEPRDYYFDLQEIAEGESGSVFAARVTETGNIHKLKLPPLIKAQNADNQMRGAATVVAIKCVQIVPTGSTKLEDLRGELTLLKGLSHPNILTMDALYVDLVEDSLWIRMELMERSLADVVELVDAGLMLQERMIARFTSDIVEALQFLQSHRIAHRDLRSDNLLLNAEGILKLTDFSYALKLPKETPMAFDPVGVLYWQAPEVRTGPYDALKIDVWSLGATVWEMAQAKPPFADAEDEEFISNRWPPLDKPDLYSPAFHDFLRLCSEPASSRPSPNELLKNPFVKNSCGRPVIHQLLQQCMSIEQAIQANEDDDS